MEVGQGGRGEERNEARDYHSKGGSSSDSWRNVATRIR